MLLSPNLEWLSTVLRQFPPIPPLILEGFEITIPKTSQGKYAKQNVRVSKRKTGGEPDLVDTYDLRFHMPSKPVNHIQTWKGICAQLGIPNTGGLSHYCPSICIRFIMTQLLMYVCRDFLEITYGLSQFLKQLTLPTLSNEQSYISFPFQTMQH